MAMFNSYVSLSEGNMEHYLTHTGNQSHGLRESRHLYQL